MKKHKWNIFIILGLLVVLISVHYYQYPPLPLVQFDTTNFQLEKKWSHQLDSTITEISVGQNSVILFARTSNSIYAFRADNGNVLWSFDSLAQGGYSPAFSNNLNVYVVDDKYIRAFDKQSGQIIWSQLLPKSRGQLVYVSDDIILVNEVANDISAYGAINGSMLWSIGVGRGFVNAYQDEGFVYIPDYGIKALDAATGKVLWKVGNDGIGSSSYSDGIIYFMSGDSIVAFDVKHQTEVWRLKFPSESFRKSVVDKGILFITDAQYLFAYNKSSGTLLWRAVVEFPTNPAIIENTVYVMEGFSRKIRCYDIATGKETGSFRVSFPILLLPDYRDMASTQNLLLFSRGTEIFAFGK